MEAEAEYPMILSPSLPPSPNIDLGTDIADGLEELRSRASVLPTSSDAFSPSPSLSPLLKSKWPSSTIGSIREEHARRGSSAMLRLYFGDGGKQGGKNSKVPQTPTSMKSLSRTSYTMKSPGYSTMRTRRNLWGSRHGRHSNRESDVIVIGYGPGNGVRRRGSVTPTISEAESEDGALSSAISGFKRKPIPVEMFLRDGV